MKILEKIKENKETIKTVGLVVLGLVAATGILAMIGNVETMKFIREAGLEDEYFKEDIY